MRLIQFLDANRERRVGVVAEDGNHVAPLREFPTILTLALAAIERGVGLVHLAGQAALPERVDYAQLLRQGHVLAPIDHPEPARFLLTGTGLTHIGSATARNAMHVSTHGSAAPESDSMKMFRMGIEGGKPGPGRIGVQPEWFYKGVGTSVVAPGSPLPLPAYALAGAEEPEVVGLYVIDSNRQPRRIGFTLGNEFSDHETESKNYLYTQVSKLRACSLGPELHLGELAPDIRGKSRVIRDGRVIWEDDVLLGEQNMSHSIANLEHYHFRHVMFRRPGDLHAHFFGAAVLSHAAGVKTQSGDEFEIDVPFFGKPLRNPMMAERDKGLVVAVAL